MIDVEKQVAYWRAGSAEGRDIAQELIDGGRLRHGLFFAHLALEELLKAHVCRCTQDLAPRLHNLVRLAEIAGLALDDDHIDLLAEMNTFNIEGRYPDLLIPPPSLKEARGYLHRSDEVYRWLMNLLSK